MSAMPRLCVYGAGAVGGHLAARLAAGGHNAVSVVARGDHLAAIRDNGLTLLSPDGDVTVRPVAATADPATLAPQDIVFVTLKAHHLPGEAERIGALLAPGGLAVFITNGIPWWWAQGLDGAVHEVAGLLDPAGLLARHVGGERTLGGVVFSSNRVDRAGVIVHAGFNSWIFGEPAGGTSPRLGKTVRLLAEAGIGASESPDLRREVLLKLLRNVSGNPLGALTRLSARQIGERADLRAVSSALRREAMAISAALGWDLANAFDPDSFKLPATGEVRTSMLQDALAGREMEVDALLGQLAVFARRLGVAVPTLEVVLALVSGLNDSRPQ